MARLLYILGFTALLAGSLYAILSHKKPVDTTYSVSLTPVVKETIVSELSAVGRLISSHQQEIYGNKEMRIGKVYLKEGEILEKGQPIAEIAMSQFMEGLLSQYKDAQIEAAMGKDAHATAKELLKRKAISRSQLQEAEIRYRKSETAVKRVANEIQIARQTLSLTEQENEPPFIMVSPQNGIIISLRLNEGEFLQSQKKEPLVVIADMNRLKVIAEVAPFDIAQVKLGQSVAFHYSDGAEAEVAPLTGKVTSIAEEVSGGNPADRETGTNATIRVVCEIDSPSQGADGLKLGLTGEVRFEIGVKKGTLVVPVDAVLSEGADRYVYVVEGKKAKKRKLVVGIVNQEKIEVLEGLKLGENIVTRGQFLLYDHATVVTERHAQ